MRFIVFALLILFPICASGSPLIVTYPKGQSEKDTRRAEVVALISHALQKTEKTHGPFILRPSVYVANPLRQISEIKSNHPDRINLAWLGAEPHIEDELLPIYIPIQKGIVGYRIFIIRDDSVDKFSKDMAFTDLQNLTNGIGPGWIDEGVFKHNELKYLTSTGYESLFAMLSNHRFDYFSRGITEAFEELKERRLEYPNLVIEDNIALYYRLPVYLFVSKQNIELHERLETGLNMMIEEGAFDAIFCKYNKSAIDSANLRNRKIFKLESRLDIPEHVLEREEFWFDPMVNVCP